jgi:hypothetical protein
MSNIVGMNLTDIDATALFAVGQVGETDDGNRYRYVKYDAATAAVDGVAGEVAGYLAILGNTFVVTSDVSDCNGIGAGVLQAALTDGTYGWVQISGPATLSIALTAGADGNALTLVGAGDGTLDVSGLVTDYICAVADDVSAKTIMCCFP